MSYAKRSQVKGAQKLRRLLRRIEPAATAQIKTDVEEIAQTVQAEAMARAPRRYGDLAASIGYKMSNDKLAAVVGPAAESTIIASSKHATSAFGKTRLMLKAKSWAALFQFFKGWWMEHGTKGDPERGIPGSPAQPFMGPAWDVTEQWAKTKVRAGIKHALREASK